MSNAGIHKDHRERMRQRFRENGFDGFRDHEILEMILYAVIPRRNTNDIAHDLLDRFGDIPGVLSAGEAELCQVDGIGKTAAERIRVLGGLYDSVSAQIFRGVSLDSADSAGLYAMLRMRLAPDGSAAAVYLNGEGHIISEIAVYRGKDQMKDLIRQGFTEAAVEIGAKTMLLMHGHRGEPLNPSPDDVAITNLIREEAAALGITKVMHVIVSDDGYIHI